MVVPSSFHGAPLFWVVPSSWPLAVSHPDEPCKQAVSTHLALLCRRPVPHNSDVGPSPDSAFQLHVLKARNHLVTPTPSRTSALSSTISVPPPPTMQWYQLLTTSNSRVCSAHPKILTSSITDQDRECSVLVGRQTDVYSISSERLIRLVFVEGKHPTQYVWTPAAPDTSSSFYTHLMSIPNLDRPHLQKSQGSFCQVAVNR